VLFDCLYGFSVTGLQTSAACITLTLQLHAACCMLHATASSPLSTSNMFGFACRPLAGLPVGTLPAVPLEPSFFPEALVQLWYVTLSPYQAVALNPGS
jgi:hypothetical protein